MVSFVSFEQGCGSSADVAPKGSGGDAGGAGTGAATAGQNDATGTAAADKYSGAAGQAKQVPAELKEGAQARASSCATAPNGDDAPKLGAQILSASASLMVLGGQAAASASSALSDASAGAEYRGLDGSTPSSSARAMLDTIGSLSSHDDVKKVLGATWVVVSESAKFFTIGKVAVAVLQQCYDMWNAWDSKNEWVGAFIAYLKLVEEDLVAGQAVFENLGFLRGLERQLESARGVLATITSRGRAAAFVWAMYDEQRLAEQKELIETCKRECLFGHASDVKNVAAENLALMQRLGAMVLERQKRIDAYKLYPEGVEERGRRMAQLESSFCPFDSGAQAQRLIERFVRAQRAFRLDRMSDEERGRYVAHYLDELLHTPALDETQAGSARLHPEQATREALAFGELAPPLQQKQLDQLRTSLRSALADAQQHLSLLAYDTALGHVKQGRAVLASLRVLASAQEADSLGAEFDAHFSGVLDTVRAQQLERGLLLPPSPTLAHLLELKVVTGRERASALVQFRRAYARELEQALWWMRVDATTKWSVGMPSRGRLLAIRAPPPTAAAVAAAPAAAVVDPNESGGDTTAIFVAFLSELYPSSMRALHFMPNRSLRAGDLAARAARKRERELARAAAVAAQRAQQAPQDGGGWRERNARRAAQREAGDYASDDEEAPQGDADTGAAPAPSASELVVPETGAESASAELSCDDSVAQCDLRRAIPSLSFQLSQSCPTYYSNLLALLPALSPATFARLNASDLVADLMVAPLLQPGKTQTNPNQSDDDTAAAAAASGPQGGNDNGAAPLKVCVAIDGAQWSVSGDEEPASSASAVQFEDAFLGACSKHVPRLPDWMGFVVTIPHASRFDRRVLQAGAKIHSLDLATHALSDLSAFAEEVPDA